jgi:predicted RNase H-like HicB family nuclease
METETSMVFNVLIKKEMDLFVAHCLELDIVATGKTLDEAKGDLKDLIEAQVECAFANNNLDNLFRPAPSEAWREFYSCTSRPEERIDVKSGFGHKESGRFVPPWIIAKICEVTGYRHA